jgi:hypothetical protein
LKKLSGSGPAWALRQSDNRFPDVLEGRCPRIAKIQLASPSSGWQENPKGA